MASLQLDDLHYYTKPMQGSLTCQCTEKYILLLQLLLLVVLVCC